MNKRSFKYAWVSFLHQGSCMVLSLVLHAASRQHVMQPFIQWNAGHCTLWLWLATLGMQLQHVRRQGHRVIASHENRRCWTS
jgi:hypothetical protein